MTSLSGLSFPVMLAFAAGFFAWYSARAFQSRNYVAFGFSTAVYLLASGALHASTNDDPRVPDVTPYVVAAALAAILGCRFFLKKVPHSDIAFVIGAVTVFLMGLNVFGSAWQMHPTVNRAVVSPDGRYTARLVYLDGMTCGYYFVCIKSNATIEHWSGAEQIAETAAEGIAGLTWHGSHTLTIQCAAGTTFTEQQNTWRDVSVKYEEPQGASRP